MGPTTVCGQFASYLLQTVSKLHVPAGEGDPELHLASDLIKSWKCARRHLKINEELCKETQISVP